nr:hypothetical protein [Morchella crassipes]
MWDPLFFLTCTPPSFFIFLSKKDKRRRGGAWTGSGRKSEIKNKIFLFDPYKKNRPPTLRPRSFFFLSASLPPIVVGGDLLDLSSLLARRAMRGGMPEGRGRVILIIKWPPPPLPRRGEVLFLIKWPRGEVIFGTEGGRERPFKGLCLPHPPPPPSFILIFSPALPYHNLDYENNPCLKGKGDSEKTCLF